MKHTQVSLRILFAFNKGEFIDTVTHQTHDSARHISKNISSIVAVPGIYWNKNGVGYYSPHKHTSF